MITTSNMVTDLLVTNYYGKTCVKHQSQRLKIGFQDPLSLNAGQKYCRMLQKEHSAILSNSLSYQLLRSLFCLFLSGCFTQVLLYSRIFFLINCGLFLSTKLSFDNMHILDKMLFEEGTFTHF